MALAILFMASAMTLTHGRIIYPLNLPFIDVRAIHVEPEYSFAYDVNDQQTGDIKTQTESRKGDIVLGEYSLIQPDGVKRTVQYQADDRRGFTAVVRNQQSTTRNFNIMSDLRIPVNRSPYTDEFDISHASQLYTLDGKQNKVHAYGETTQPTKQEVNTVRGKTENIEINNRNDKMNPEISDSEQVESDIPNERVDSFISDLKKTKDDFSHTLNIDKYQTEKRFDPASTKIERFQKSDPGLTTYEPIARSFVLHSFPRTERLPVSTQHFD